MTIAIELKEHEEIAQYLSQKIVAFNLQHWQNTPKEPITATYKDVKGNILAGASGITFGNWLHIERLWVEQDLRAKGIGQQLLTLLESEAVKRGCQQAFVDTLEFQAKPFYLKNGYQLQCQQDNYPLTGTRYYLMKKL